LKIGKNAYFGGINRNMNEKAKFHFNNLISMQDDKKNVSYNLDRDSLNHSNYNKSSSQNRKVIEKTRDDSKIRKESLVSNSFLQKRKNN
jgi:hypothetical protein